MPFNPLETKAMSTMERFNELSKSADVEIQRITILRGYENFILPDIIKVQSYPDGFDAQTGLSTASNPFFNCNLYLQRMNLIVSYKVSDQSPKIK
jgi:hypothetical protein